MNRRLFLSTTAATGLLLPFRLKAAPSASPQKLNAFVHIAPDDTVTLYIHKAEMGQGTVTSIAMLLAEELDADWSKIRTAFPGVSKEYGPFQGVFGSHSMRTSWEPVRRAGATARALLVQAAAQQWNIPASACSTANHFVVSPQGKLSYGQLAVAASQLTPPTSVTLKDPAQFRLIGHSTHRLDAAAKSNGSAIFGLDVYRPGMLHAAIARCPVFGGKLASFDATRALAVPGVQKVIPVSTGVAVLATNTWAAFEGKRLLKVVWNEGDTAAHSTASISADFAAKTLTPGAVARNTGNAEPLLTTPTLEAAYSAPFLAHAPMEPLNALADVRADACEVWASTQGQSAAEQIAAKITGLPTAKITIHTEYMGGGFGRRANADYIGEAVEVSKAAGVPVKVTWTREDDLQQDWYRPASLTRFAATLDAEGFPAAVRARIACAPFGVLRDGVSRTGVEGIHDVLYAIPHYRVEYHVAEHGIPVSYWRSVGYSQNTFFLECFIDELASAGNKDPFALRRRLLASSPRMLAALDLAAAKAGWGQPLAKGRGRGIALSNNIGSFTAQVAEVSVTGNELKVDRIVCAVDCGIAVNPRGVEQQIQSGIVFGLTAALKDAITIDRGRVKQRNFHEYDMLRIDEMPTVEVHLVPSKEAPTGVGEASTPGTAPAVANAIYAATGKRLRDLPLRLA
jgi:isoquinoline 1-oxidoreductase beta subunit